MAMSTSGEIKVTCKKCNRQAKASEFILDPVYRMMVCPSCVKERKAKIATPDKSKQAAVKAPEEKKPAGWDADDEVLERMAKQKQQKPTPAVEKVDSESIRYTCMKCKYKFVYNLTTKNPSSCPYCGTPVMTSFINR